jgi:membrane protein DedA with SNARE-associated domain
MRRRFSAENIAKVERAYARFGVLALAVPALLPPPMPFKIFVATAGALEYPRWRFVLTVMIARSVRYIVEGTLAVFYGERVLVFMKDNGLFILSIVGALLVVGVGGYVLIKHLRTPRRTAVEIAEASEHEGAVEAKATDATGGRAAE